MDELEGILLKYGRASHHLFDLRQKEALYAISEAFETETTFDPSGPRYITKVIVKEEPDPELSLILGDFLHNLRSALDHLAWALVEKGGGHSSRWTQFPIYEDALSLDGQQLRIPVPVVGGVPHDARAILDDAQPYHWSEDPTLHPLSLLRYLSNIDKHQVLNLLAGRFGDLSVDVAKGRRHKSTSYARGGTFPGGFGVVTDVPADWTPDLVEATTNFRPAMSLDLPGVIGNWETIKMCERMLHFVRDEVIERIALACWGAKLRLGSPF